MDERRCRPMKRLCLLGTSAMGSYVEGMQAGVGVARAQAATPGTLKDW